MKYQRTSSGTPEEIAVKRAEIKRKLTLIQSGEFIGPLNQRFAPPVYDDVYFQAMEILDSMEFRRTH